MLYLLMPTENISRDERRLVRICLENFLLMQHYRRKAILYKCLYRWQRHCM